MIEKLLTIVIPTYNMEQYLDKNLKTLVIPDKELMKFLEVLVINDGSKDGSSAIAHRYQDLYPDTFRVIDKENGNYGSCVNRGLKEARGKYIRIMDADDWYETENLELFLRKIENVNVDKIATIFSEVRLTEKRIMPQPYQPEVVMDMKDVSVVHYIPMHAITYRTQLLRDMQYMQTEGISYTDQEWILLPMPYVKTLYYIPLDIYQYYIGREGQTMDSSIIAKAYPQLFRILRGVLDFYVVSIKYASNPEYVLETITRTVCWIYYVAFISARFTGNTDCVYDMDCYLEQTYPTIFQRLNDNTCTRLYDYKYVNEWRKKGRPLKYRWNHIRMYKLTHLYIMAYHLPGYIYNGIKRRILKQ